MSQQPPDDDEPEPKPEPAIAEAEPVSTEPPHVRAEGLRRALQADIAAPRIAKATDLMRNADLAARAEAAAAGITSFPWLKDVLSGIPQIPTIGSFGLDLIQDDWLKDTLKGSVPATRWIADAVAQWTPRIDPPMADIVANLTNGLVPIAFGTSDMIANLTAGADLINFAKPWATILGDFDVSDALRTAMAGLWTAQSSPWFDSQGPLADLWAKHNEAMSSVLDNLSWLIADAHRSNLPDNLQDVVLDSDRFKEMAEEGLTIWAVPGADIVQRLMDAPDKAARRAILGTRWRRILEDCEDAATQATAGPHSAQARFLAQAIAALRDGHTAAAQALAGNVLDSLMWMQLSTARRRELTGHRNPMDHFEKLALGEAMVFRPIFHAYRPQGTPAERAGDTTFARHGSAHNLTPAQVSRRNAVQAVMLAAALLNHRTFWAQD